ncbi:MAG: DUF1449 family protein [Planctomycetota bacterium]|nr:DUF1449 family protein [Planctomycetota bacterium]
MEHAVYFWTALVGCTLLVIQVILQVLGLGGDHEMDSSGPNVDTDAHMDAGDPAHGTQGNVFFGILSFKAIVAFAGIFGLTGLSLEDAGYSDFQRLAISILAGLSAMIVVAFLMRMLHNLGSSGSLVVSNALGHKGQVYLRIPGHGEGRGKVTIEVQGRTVELDAVTDGEPIPTGKMVKVIEIVGAETLKVATI